MTEKRKEIASPSARNDRRRELVMTRKNKAANDRRRGHTMTEKKRTRDDKSKRRVERKALL